MPRHLEEGQVHMPTEQGCAELHRLLLVDLRQVFGEDEIRKQRKALFKILTPGKGPETREETGGSVVKETK